KLRFSLGTLAPPLRAISRRRSGSIAAKPRRLGRRAPSSLFMSMTLLFSLTFATCHREGLVAARRPGRRCPAAGRETPLARDPADIPGADFRAAHRDPSGLAQLFSSLLAPRGR